MKRLLPLLCLVTFTATSGVFAMGSVSPSSGTGTAAPGAGQQPVDIGPQDTLLKRPTPAPGATPVPAKNGKPLTATLGKDNTGKTSVSVFTSTDPKIYCVWTDGTGAKGDKVRIVWYSVDTGTKASKNRKLSEVTQIEPGTGSNGATYIAPPKSGFPVGAYRADVYGNDKLAKSLKFTVQK